MLENVGREQKKATLIQRTLIFCTGKQKGNDVVLRSSIVTDSPALIRPCFLLPATHLLPTHPPPSVLPTTYLRSTLTPCLLIFHLPLASYMSKNRRRMGVVYNFGEIVPTSAPSHSPTTNPIVPPLVYVITVVMKVFQCVTFSHSPSPAEKLKLKMFLEV